MTGICFNIQRYSTHDGPGIRTTVFLKGCPLSCGWCHNPEGRSPEAEIHVLPGHCIHCGACLEACGTHGGKVATPLRPEPERCVRCGRCVEACNADARRTVGRVLTLESLLAEVERDRPFYEESGGGVTFSGGEPLMQGPFLLACLEACRERALHTAVDTCGHAERDLLLEVARHTDLFLFDLKTLDERRHLEQTGVALPAILENLRALDQAGASIWIRVPLVPGFNDDDESLEAIGAFVGSLDRTRRLHLLPYHDLGSDKLARACQPGSNPGLRPLEPERVGQAAARLAALGLEVHQGG